MVPTVRRLSGRLLGGLTAMMVTWAGPSLSHADDTLRPLTQADLDSAEAIFFEALGHFRGGRFEQAAVGFQKAYTLTGHRDMLYNVARSREQLGDKPGAVEWYKAYLATEPADETATIHRIRQLGGDPTLAARKPDAVLPDFTSPKNQRPPRVEEGVDPWPWVAAGVAVAAAGVGTWLGLTALDDAAAAREEKTRAQAEDLRDQAESGALLADVAFGVGAVAAGAAVFLWWRADHAEAPAGSVQVGADAHSAYLGWSAAF